MHYYLILNNLSEYRVENRREGEREREHLGKALFSELKRRNGRSSCRARQVMYYSVKSVTQD